jgi:hypothetical protein
MFKLYVTINADLFMLLLLHLEAQMILLHLEKYNSVRFFILVLFSSPGNLPGSKISLFAREGSNQPYIVRPAVEKTCSDMAEVADIAQHLIESFSK